MNSEICQLRDVEWNNLFQLERRISVGNNFSVKTKKKMSIRNLHLLPSNDITFAFDIGSWYLCTGKDMFLF